MARTANAALAARWRERLMRWRRSQLSAAEFCRQEQVSQPSFYQWRRRLEKQRPRTAETRRFVELWPPTWAATSLQVALPSGAVVSVSGQASAELIAAVVQAAMRAPGEDQRC